MKRVVRLLLLGSAVLVAAACAEGDAVTVTPETAAAETVGPDSSIGSAGSASSIASPSTTVEEIDFGSRYVGAPVAFWFWAPY